MPMLDNAPRYIVTSIDFATRWPVACAVTTHQAPDMTIFIGTKTAAKFGTLSLLIADGWLKLTGNTMKLYITNS